MAVKLFGAIVIGSMETEMKIFELSARKGMKEIDCVSARIHRIFSHLCDKKNHPSQQGIFYEYSTKARSCTAQVCLRVVSTRHFPAETRGKRGECEGER